jgi:hypothetical protein
MHIWLNLGYIHIWQKPWQNKNLTKPWLNVGQTHIWQILAKVKFS